MAARLWRTAQPQQQVVRVAGGSVSFTEPPKSRLRPERLGVRLGLHVRGLSDALMVHGSENLGVLVLGTFAALAL